LQDGGTALTVASSHGNVQIVEQLLKRNADTDLHKEVSENLLHYEVMTSSHISLLVGKPSSRNFVGIISLLVLFRMGTLH